MSEAEKILEHLENDYTEPIRDPVWKHRIRQLGPAALVYPGATHSRRNHSLGVFHIARRMITTLVRKNTDVDITLDGVKAFLCAALLHDIGHYPFAHSLKDLGLIAHETLRSSTAERAIRAG